MIEGTYASLTYENKPQRCSASIEIGQQVDGVWIHSSAFQNATGGFSGPSILHPTAKFTPFASREEAMKNATRHIAERNDGQSKSLDKWLLEVWPEFSGINDAATLPLEAPPHSTSISDAERDILQSYAWRELLHKIQHHPNPKPNATRVGTYWLYADAIAMQQAGLIILAPQPSEAPLAILTDKAITARNAQAMLWDRDAADMMTDDDLSNHPDSPATFTGKYATEWLAHIPVAAMYPPADATPEPVQTDVEEVSKTHRRLTLNEIRLTADCDRGAWVLRYGSRRLADLIGNHFMLSDEDCEAFAHRLADAFNAAQSAVQTGAAA